MLNVWGDFILIDNLVRTYPQYDHDQIFNMEVGFVHNLIVYNKQRDTLQSKAGEVARKIQQGN